MSSFNDNDSAFAPVDRLMEGEFTVDAADIIRIILGFLTSQGLHESALALRKESNVGFADPGIIHKDMVARSIRQGDWGTVFQATVLLQEDLSQKHVGPDSLILTRIAEQVILELAEEDKSLNLAYSLLKTHREGLDRIPEEDDSQPDPEENSKEKQKKKLPLSTISKARSLEQRLAAIAGDPKKYADTTTRQELLYGTNLKKQGRRDRLATLVEGKPDIPLRRLVTLIQQAMKWQSHTGQLPWIKELYCEEADNSDNQVGKMEGSRKRRKRKRYDLVLGEIAGGAYSATVGDDTTFADNEEEEESSKAVPQDILAKVNFGKSAVCVSAIFFAKGLITGSSDSLIEIWDSGYKHLNTTDFPYQKEHVMGHNDAAILSMDISNDGEILVSGDSEGKVKIWKLETGRCLRQYQAHDVSVTAMCLSRNASRLLTGSSSGICREFGLVTQSILHVYEGHTSYIHECRYVIDWNIGIDKNPQTVIPEGWVVTASADGTVRLWQNGLAMRILQPPRDLTQIENKQLSLVVDPTQIASECPGIHCMVPVPGEASRILVVPRSSAAFLVDLQGIVLQVYQSESLDSEFVAGTLTANVIYLATSRGNCLTFSMRSGKLIKTIREFAIDSTTKTNSDDRIAEISAMIHHPFKPSVIGAFSNDKTQRKGILAVWK